MTETELSPTSRVQIAKDVLARTIEDEVVLLNAESGLYYGLDQVGARMWDLLGEHRRLGAIHERLLEEYDVTAERLWDDLVALVRELGAEDLVVIDAAQDSPGDPADAC
jgi:hypothetical protein